MRIEQCGHCGNNIRINIVNFIGGINDYGGMIIKCEKCNCFSHINCKNPFESSVLKGGVKEDCWDKEITSIRDIVKKYPSCKPTTNGLVVFDNINEKEINYNYKNYHIHYCNVCGEEIETIAEKDLASKKKYINASFQSAMNYILANRTPNFEDLIIKTNSKCRCGNEINFYFHTSFKANGTLSPNYQEMVLSSTSVEIMIDKIDGIYSKTDCIRILEKFLLRWSGIMNKIIIVTPFIGHQWMSDGQLIELWEWIKNYTNQSKTTLITRTATLNKYKRACKEKSIDIDLLSFYGINNKVIEKMTKKQDFHAKIYIGANQKRAELLLGSFNLLEGKSVENLSFKSISIENLMSKYITPMGIGISDEEFKPKQKFAILIEEKHDGVFDSKQTEWY